MALFEDEERPKPTIHRIGEDLEPLSEGELGDRIVALGEEIKRLEAALVTKKASREAAAAHFRS